MHPDSKVDFAAKAEERPFAFYTYTYSSFLPLRDGDLGRHGFKLNVFIVGLARNGKGGSRTAMILDANAADALKLDVKRPN